MKREHTFKAGAILVCAPVMFLTQCSHPSGKDVAATVNGRPVTYAQMNQAIAAGYPNSQLKETDDQATALKLGVLRDLIDQEIYLQRAEKESLLASDSDVDAKFNELKAPYSEADFNKLLSQRKMSVDDVKSQIRRQLSVEKLFTKEIGAHISISDDEVAAFYNANKALYNVPENAVHLAQIVVTPTPDANVHNLKNDKAQNEQQARAKIEMLQLRLRQGEDFGTVAQNYSEDPNSAQNGGDSGLVPESTLDRFPDLKRVIMDMTPGQISPIIHTPDGYRIIKVYERVMAGQRPLSDPRVQEEIRQTLFNRRDQLLRAAFVEIARDDAKVRNYFAESVLKSRDKR